MTHIDFRCTQLPSHAVDFLATFLRFEFALKEAGYGFESGAQLLGIFKVSILHNLVHVAFGVAGIIAARSYASVARNFLIFGGVIYLVLWIYGLIVDKSSDGNFVPVDRADDWLHFGLGVAMVALGVLLTRDRDTRSTAGARTR